MASYHPRTAAAADLHVVPPALAAWLSVFRPCFTAPVWNHVLVLLTGAVLAPGKRTVTQALRVMGLADALSFRRYLEVPVAMVMLMVKQVVLDVDDLDT